MQPTINLTVNVTTPEAAEAVIRALLQPGVSQATFSPITPGAAPPVSPTVAPAAMVPVTVAAPVAFAPPAIPTQAPVAASAAPVAPMPTAAPTSVPTSAPEYTFDALARAAAPLMDAGKTADLQALLRSFNAQALTQLPKEQYGAFATALRGLGARI